MIHRERDQFEAELKDLTRRFETLDLNHAALTRERNTLSKEVLTTSTCLEALAFHSGRLQVFSSHPLGGNVAAVGDSPAEGQGLPSPSEHGADCPL